MLKDRQYLETKLIKRITEINGNRVNNRLIHQQWYIELAEKYNIPISISSDILSLRKDLSGFNEFILFAITSVVSPKDIKGYFTEKEIKLYQDQKLKDKTSDKSFRIPMIKITDDQYIGCSSVKWLMQLREERLINYNADTQRALEAMLAGDNVIYRPYVNNTAVQEIAAAFSEGTFIPNTISLNINLDDPTVDWNYDEKEHMLEISDITAFDIFDGYHRYLGMARVWDINHDFDYPMELRITMFSVSKAKQFIFQEDHKTKMKRVDASTFDQSNYGNVVSTRLNTDPESMLIGKINLTDGIINAGYFNQELSKIYFNTKTKGSRREMNATATNLMNKLNDFVGKYEEYQTKRWEKFEIRIILFGIHEGHSEDEIYNSIKNITPEIQKKLNVGNPTSSTMMDLMRKEVF